ncbi:MAG: CinA family nicotinamide mononucleotide deamidase-related protein [Planctomycetota bacterium]
MADLRRAWIAITGDELLHGDLIDANGPYLAALLNRCGIEVTRFVGVGDDLCALVSLIRDSMGKTELLVMTGGLGSTADDLTRPAAAAALGLNLAVDDEAHRQVEAFWQSLDRDPAGQVFPEASLPQGATLIPNPKGLAPGFVCEHEDWRMVAFPGVPAELQEMAPRYFEPLADSARRMWQAEVMVSGISESATAEILGDLLDRGREPLIGIAAKEGFLRLTLRARGLGAADKIAVDVAEIESRFAEKVVSAVGHSQVEIISKALRDRGWTLALAESLTGGLLGHQLTEIPGSSEFLIAALVTYADRAKTQVLGVSAALIAEHGVVSQPVAEAMAQGARRTQACDWGLATTGIAGPGGALPGQAVGTAWVAVADPMGRVYGECRVHPGTRSQVKDRVAVHAFDLMRRVLLNLEA